MLGYKKRPLGYKKRPLGYKKRPLGYKKRPLGYKKRPLEIQKIIVIFVESNFRIVNRIFVIRTTVAEDSKKPYVRYVESDLVLCTEELNTCET